MSGEGDLKGESVELEAEGERREGGAGLEEDGESAVVGEGGVAEHGDEVEEREGGEREGGDEGGPGDDVRGGDVVAEEAEGVGG